MSLLDELREAMSELREEYKIDSTVAKAELKEAQKEIDKKGLSGTELIAAVRFSWKCTENLLDSTEMGGYNIFCICGYHPSRFRPKKSSP